MKNSIPDHIVATLFVIVIFGLAVFEPATSVLSMFFIPWLAKLFYKSYSVLGVSDFVIFPILGATLGTTVFIVPVIGAFMFIPLMPLVNLYDYIIPGSFMETGEHVDIGFAWISIKTVSAWAFYISFFFFVGFFVGLFKYFRARSNLKAFFAGSVIFLIIAYGLKLIFDSLYLF